MRIAALTTLFLIAGLCQLAAQGLTVAGTVRDEAGQPLAGVTVKLATRAQGVKIGSTNARGQWAFRDLGTGIHQVSFEKEGYVTVTRTVDVTYDKNGDDDDDPQSITMIRDKAGADKKQ